jgi:hypothetical protein
MLVKKQTKSAPDSSSRGALPLTAHIAIYVTDFFEAMALACHLTAPLSRQPLVHNALCAHPTSVLAQRLDLSRSWQWPREMVISQGRASEDRGTVCSEPERGSFRPRVEPISQNLVP